LDQNKRPSAAQALTHPWIVEANKLTTANLQSDVAMNALSNLQNFNANSKLQQATYAFIASQLLGKQEKESIDKFSELWMSMVTVSSLKKKFKMVTSNISVDL
jgi:hypothetical protein